MMRCVDAPAAGFKASRYKKGCTPSRKARKVEQMTCYFLAFGQNESFNF